MMHEGSRVMHLVRRIRDNSVGRADSSTTDLVEDVKLACAREGVLFDNDIFSQIIISPMPHECAR